MQPNNNQAATTDYNQAYAEFGNVYDPQVQAVQSQQAQAQQARDTNLAQLLQDKNTTLSSLDQAKVNAFAGNATTANARGLTFSGYTPYTNNAYVTNTYNPNVDKTNTDYGRNVDKTNTDYTQTDQSLVDKINAINQQRANDANSLVQNTVQAQQQAAAAAAKAASRGSGGSSGGSSGSSAKAPTYQQRGDNGYNFQSTAGKAISARLFAQQTGTNFNTLLKEMAASGDAGAADVLKNGASSKYYKDLTWD